MTATTQIGKLSGGERKETAATSGKNGQKAPELSGLVRGRWVGVACLALATAYCQLRGLLESPWPLLVLAGLVGFYNLILAVVAWSRAAALKLALVSLILDLLALTTALHFSGDMENPFLFAYSLPVVAGAVLLSKRTGFFLATCALLLVTFLVTSTHLDMAPVHIPHHHLSVLKRIQLHEIFDPDEPDVNWDFILSDVIALFTIVFGSAYGFGALSDRVREKNAMVLRENERMLLLLGILPEGVILIANDGSIILTNPAAQTLLEGLEKGSIHALDPGLCLAGRFERFQGNLEEFETNYRGRIFHHALARASADGPVVWVMRDLTRERKLMAQVMHRSKMADLGLLAAGIAHEIGNPLSSMSAILELLEIKKASPEFTDQLQALGANVGRIHRIVRDIGAFARPSSGQQTRATVRAIVENALQVFRLHPKSRRMQIETRQSESEALIDVVEDQMVQVFINLLLNAADASGRTGTVTIETSAYPQEVEISITDHGVGMGEEVINRLFTPFFTTKGAGQGEGLGLFVSESIVRAHGGSIQVRSAPSEGATFTVRLPRPTEEV